MKNRELHKLLPALLIGNEAAVTEALQGATPPFPTDDEGRGPLHVACSTGFAWAVPQLIRAGCSVSELSKEGLTPLQYAALNGFADLSEWLVKFGKADVNAFNAKKDATALVMAAASGDANVLKVLLAAKANVDALEGSGTPALHAACTAGSVECVRLLLAERADVEAFDEQHRTPLVVAQHSSMTEIASLLVAAGARASFEIFWASRAGNVQALRRLLDSGVPAGLARQNGATAMHSAALAGCVKVAAMLGGDVNAPGSGSPPLVLAAGRGLHDFVLWCLDQSADLAATDDDGNTAMHAAVAGQHAHVFELLLAKAQAGNHLDSLLGLRNKVKKSVRDLVEASSGAALRRLLAAATAAPAPDAPAIIRAVAAGIEQQVEQLLAITPAIAGLAERCSLLLCNAFLRC